MVLRTCIFAIALICVIGRTVADPTKSDELYDPAEYLERKVVEQPPGKMQNASLLRQRTVLIDGRPYHKFSDGAKAIFIPKVSRLTREEMERALCVDDIVVLCTPSNGAEPAIEICERRGLREAIAAKVEQKLDETTSLYAAFIVEAIRKNCNPDRTASSNLRVEKFFEIGIEVKNQDPRHPGSKKGFIILPPDRPQIGGGISF